MKLKQRWMLAVSTAVCFCGTAFAQQNASPLAEFDKVDYLFGPVARSTGDHVGGEVAKGKLRFDGGAKILYFLTDKGPNLQIPYNKIQEFALDDKSLMRSGAILTAGVIVGPFIRQHKHFLTILYRDETGGNRRALLQLDKSNYQGVEKAAAGIGGSSAASSSADTGQPQAAGKPMEAPSKP